MWLCIKFIDNYSQLSLLFIKTKPRTSTSSLWIITLNNLKFVIISHSNILRNFHLNLYTLNSYYHPDQKQ